MCTRLVPVPRSPFSIATHHQSSLVESSNGEPSFRDHERSHSRALSIVIERYTRSKAEETEHKLQRLQRVLLRIDSMVEEAEGRFITNQAMLRQLDMLRQGMYGGHYMLDTFRYRGHGQGGGENEVSGSRDVALSRFSSAKHFLSLSVSSSGKENLQNPVVDAETLKNLEKMLGGLETLMGDMTEFAVFLEDTLASAGSRTVNTWSLTRSCLAGRWRRRRSSISCSGQKRRAMEIRVLPIVGRPRVGKSTLIEHVCLDERVRGYFSSIVFFTGEDEEDEGADNMACLGRSGVIKHQDVTASSCRRSLVVIELTGDVEEETWRNLYCSASRSMGHGGKIIITSRSEKIAALGTTQALRLKFLPPEAYWYFFKILAFGSANPDDQPKLASLCMDIAAVLDGTFLGANVVGSLMRANLNVQCWRRVLQCSRDFTSKHTLTCGKDPTDLLESGYPVYSWSIARSQNVVMIYNIYQKRITQNGGVPMLTSQDILTGCATHKGKFRALVWRSSIPPYYTYLASCESRTDECSTISKKRSRQSRVWYGYTSLRLS